MSINHRKHKWNGPLVTAVRAAWRNLMIAAETKGNPYICPKCNKPVTHLMAWDVGHQLALEEGGSIHIGNTHPEHASCNRADGARITNHKKRQKQGRIRQW